MSIKRKIKVNQPVSLDELLAHELKDPAFSKEWERKSSGRELGRRIIQARIDNNLSQSALEKKQELLRQ